MAPRLPILLALVLPAISAASAVPRDTGSNPGFISFPIRRERSTNTLASRDAAASLTNEEDTSYLIELTIGSNKQAVKVAIDTGSDELFVDPNCDDQDFTQDEQQECTADGQYNPKTSTSATITNETSQIVYGSGAVDIQYVIDSVGVSGASQNLTDVQFGVATASQDLNEGILGLGFGKGINLNYSNFVDQLAAQNVTNTKAFSVALGTSDTAGGNIVFGGVDTKKFSGTLASNTIETPTDGDIQRYTIQMNSITFKSGSTSNKYSGSDVGVVLDTGSSLCELPSAIVSSMASDFNAQEQSGLLVVDCSMQTQDGSVDFAFPGVTISVPFSQFILADGNECILGVQALEANSGITALLGDTFLRSAYAVFDQTNMKVSLAQYVDCGTNEQAIPAGSGGVSSFTGECTSNTTSSSKSAGDVTRPTPMAVFGFVAGLAALLSWI